MDMKHIKLSYFGLPKSVYIIFFARVVNSMGNFVFPFMTLLLTSKIGMGEQKAGLFLVMASTLQIPGTLLGGKLADKIGRKKVFTLFMGLAAACYIPCAFLIDLPGGLTIIPWLLILASFFYSVSSPASSAMMNDLTLPENRQAAFSLLYMGMNIGTAIGSVIAGVLFNDHMKLLFIGDAITTFISITLLILFVKETKPSQEEVDQISEERVHEMAEEGGLLSVLLRRPSLLIFAMLNTIFAFIYAQTYFSIPLQAKEVFGEALGARYYGTFNMVNCLEVIFLTTVITLLTRKIKPVFNVAMVGIFFGVGYGMLFFVRSFWTFVLSTIIWTIGEIIHATNANVYIANHTPVSHRGRFSSIMMIVSETGGAVSPYVMGAYIAVYGVTNVWPIIFLLSLIAAFSMLILGTIEKRKLDKAR